MNNLNVAKIQLNGFLTK